MKMAKFFAPVFAMALGLYAWAFGTGTISAANQAGDSPQSYWAGQQSAQPNQNPGPMNITPVSSGKGKHGSGNSNHGSGHHQGNHHGQSPKVHGHPQGHHHQGPGGHHKVVIRPVFPVVLAHKVHHPVFVTHTFINVFPCSVFVAPRLVFGPTPRVIFLLAQPSGVFINDASVTFLLARGDTVVFAQPAVLIPVTNQFVGWPSYYYGADLTSPIEPGYYTLRVQVVYGGVVQFHTSQVYIG